MIALLFQAMGTSGVNFEFHGLILWALGTSGADF
jgi:hypothetical protein